MARGPRSGCDPASPGMLSAPRGKDGAAVPKRPERGAQGPRLVSWGTGRRKITPCSLWRKKQKTRVERNLKGLSEALSAI